MRIAAAHRPESLEFITCQRSTHSRCRVFAVLSLNPRFAGNFYGGSCLSGRSAAWLARLVRDQEVEGSNPFAPTTMSPSIQEDRVTAVLEFSSGLANFRPGPQFCAHLTVRPPSALHLRKDERSGSTSPRRCVLRFLPKSRHRAWVAKSRQEGVAQRIKAQSGVQAFGCSFSPLVRELSEETISMLHFQALEGSR